MGITRRALIGAASALVIVPTPSDGFIVLTDDGEHLTCKMPGDETVVEVKLKDGTVCPAWYSQGIQETGDWDFVPIEPGTDEPDLMADSLADRIVAWRRIDT